MYSGKYLPACRIIHTGVLSTGRPLRVSKILVFFIIGFVLYLIDIGLNNYDDKEIFISDSEITSLITAWRSQVGRNPNDDEVARIINDLVQEEIL